MHTHIHNKEKHQIMNIRNLLLEVSYSMHNHHMSDVCAHHMKPHVTDEYSLFNIFPELYICFVIVALSTC